MKPISDAQLAANRANAAKSTGPRTPEGKKHASLNAIKHGCSAQTIILPGEDAILFARLVHSFKISFAPANAHEESLVEFLAQTQWLLDRARAQEMNLFAMGHEKFADSIDTGGDETIQAALAAVKTMKAELETLKTLSLYVQRNARVYQATLTQLQAVQATRKAHQREDLEQAVAFAEKHIAAGAPFHPFNFGFDSPLAKVEMTLLRSNPPATPPSPTFTVTTTA